MKSKKFDCVRMKDEIQQQIRRDFAGIPEDQALKVRMQQVAEDPILGPLYRRLISEKAAAGRR
jgi:hypothetical protein